MSHNIENNQVALKRVKENALDFDVNALLNDGMASGAIL
jgi:hypothetical protein